jgi:nucleoside-diphosphate-sugar epimerase
MSPSRACITGAGGFVGSALCEGFVALGWQVTAVDRAFDAAARARLVAAELVTADLAMGVPTRVPATQLLVHAAAVTTDHETLGWTPATHVAANMRPLLAVLEHAATTRPEAFVFLSSSGIFAPHDGSDGLRDTDAPTAQSPYAVAKRAGELLVPTALDGTSAVHVVRLGHVYGPYETVRPSRARVSLVAQWLANARQGRPLLVRADNPLREWTFCEDLAPALARLVMGPAAGRPVHLCSPYLAGDRAMAALVAGHFPDAVIEPAPPGAPTKPFMRPSTLAPLDEFAWTTPAHGIARLAAREVAT